MNNAFDKSCAIDKTQTKNMRTRGLLQERELMKNGFREFLMSILAYDPATGIFTWKKRTANRIHIGDVAGHVDNVGYCKIPINGKKHAAHRLAFVFMTGDFPDYEIDHENNNRSDNRWENLRKASTHDNRRNRKMLPNNTSGYRGVGLNKVVNGDRKWMAHIRDNYKSVYLGIYESPEEAARAYDAKAIEIHGKFASLNFPIDISLETCISTPVENSQITNNIPN